MLQSTKNRRAFELAALKSRILKARLKWNEVTEWKYSGSFAEKLFENTDQFKIDGDYYLVDFLTSTSTQKYLKEPIASVSAGECVPVIVTGYRVKEKGRSTQRFLTKPR
jgi:hypothetical protein